MEIRHPRKSMLGSRRSVIGATTYSEETSKTFEMIPKNLQIAETLRKQRNVSNNENTLASSMKNLSVRQPRRSMLGTRKLNRDSIVLVPVPDLSPPSQSHDSFDVESDLTADDTLTSSKPRMSIVSDDAPRIPPSGDNFLQIHRALPSDVFIPSENKCDTENEATVLSDRIVTNKNSLFGTTLTDVTNTRIEVSQKNCNLVKETAMKNEESQKYDDNLLCRMLDLLNTRMLRSTETVETYQKKITDLQKKVDQTNEEIEDIKNLKETLIKKFSGGNYEKEDLNVEPNSSVVEDNMTKTYVKEIMKTPLTSRTRMPRSSVMLSPYSMSLSLQNQYKQLFD